MQHLNLEEWDAKDLVRAAVLDHTHIDDLVNIFLTVPKFTQEILQDHEVDMVFRTKVLQLISEVSIEMAEGK